MRKFLLYSSALVVSGLLSSTAEAGCIQTPSCSSLGYTSTTACEGGLKCPWGNAWFCNVCSGEENTTPTPDYSNCKIGDILYSDMSCNANVVASKKPIGVVFDQENRLAIALDEVDKIWSDASFDALSVPNLTTNSSAILDWQGKSNTRLVLEYCRMKERGCPAFEYVNSYKTEGTKAGDWYLPAMGELYAIRGNKDVLNIALGKIGGTKLGTDWYWSSTEESLAQAWGLYFDDYPFCQEKTDNSYHVRPVLAF